MFRVFSRFVKDQSGATAIEYVPILRNHGSNPVSTRVLQYNPLDNGHPADRERGTPISLGTANNRHFVSHEFALAFCADSPPCRQNLAGVQMPKNMRKAPPPLYPVVMKLPVYDFHLTAEHFAALEKAGNVKFSEKQKVQLDTLADFWINDLRTRSTARPKQFREFFEKMKKAFVEAEKACQWDQGPKYHMLHWAMETSVKDASGLPGELAALEQNLRTMQERLTALEQCLPDDPGRARPFNDERRMIFLADIFEDAGGKAVVYADGYYNAESTADTPFRRFAQQFYAFLPTANKREPGGLDDALRDALGSRRAKRASR